MKKLKSLCVSLLALSALGLVSCNESTSNTPATSNQPTTSVVAGDKVKGVSLDEEIIQMDAGYTKQLNAQVTPASATNKKVTWSSSDTAVATVDQTGLVTAVNAGDCVIKAITEDGGYEAECEVSVSGYHRSTSVFKNIGKIDNNSGYNQTDGKKNFTIDVSNEEYMTIKFKRNETMEWGSLNCYYDKDNIKATKFEFEAELVKGNLPNCQFEFAGPQEFKFYKRVPLQIGQRSSVSVNITDTDFPNGWGNIFLEPNNPNDPSDEHRNDTDEVELRIYKMQLIEGDKVAPEKIENVRFDKNSKKIMFNKNNAAKEYQIEVYKTVNGEDTKLDLDVKQTRFNPVEIIPDMAFSFTPKSDQNFAKEPGNYKARVRGVNTAGEGEWSDFAVFAIGGETENTGYQATGFNNSGAIAPNQWNQDPELKAELKDDGYHLTFTGSDTNSWDSYILDFDKSQPYTSLHMEFNLVKGNITKAQVEFCDWAESGPEASDGKQQTEFDVVAGANSIDVDITADLSKGLGQLALQFARQGAAIGEAEIVVTKMVLVKEGGDTENTGYQATGFNDSGAIVPNQWNQDPELKAELKDDGYHLTFTGSETNSWDSYVLGFDKSQPFTSLHMEFNLVKGNITKAQVEFCDWGNTEAESNDGKQQTEFDVVAGANSVDIAITADLSKGLGQLALQLARQGAAIGEAEIVVTKMVLSKGTPATSTGYVTEGFNNGGAIGLNEWNSTQDYTATLKDDGYHLNFTGSAAGQWDAFKLDFDKNAGYNTFEFEFTVVSGSCSSFQYEFVGTWDNNSNSMVNSQQEWVNYETTEYKGKFTLDAEKLAIGSGQLLLKMGLNGAAAGECEIVVTKMVLSIA